MKNYISKNIFFLKNSYKPIKISDFMGFKSNKDIIGSYLIKFQDKLDKYILRDDLGTKKFFYGADSKGKIVVDKNYLNLINKCVPKTIHSFPRSKLNKIIKNKKIVFHEIQKKYDNGIFDSKFFKKEFRKRINLYLKIIKKDFNECTVCLSGGLDSTLIAYFAKKNFKKVNLITALIFDNNKILNYDDYIASKKISKYLKCKQVFVKITKNEIFKNLKNIMFSCQDWRDYNVHCASINFLIGKYLSEIRLKKFPILTGDFMNEICADYNSEIYNNKEFYQVPNIPKKYKQRFFLNSLDSSDRELGVFEYFNLKAYQPYSCVYDLYLNIPDKFFKRKNFKYEFNGIFLPKQIIKIVNQKKNRAQSGNNGGILGWFLKEDYDQNCLSRLFDNFFRLPKNWKEKFIISGSYRVK
jgi:hypothetical protein